MTKAVDNHDPVQTGRLGGLARKRNMTPAERSASARKAANAKHGKMPSATNKGNFRDDFGIDVECYVLDDEHHTAVIGQRGMAKALGIPATSGRALHRFVASRAISPGAELTEKLANPLIFLGPSPGPGTPPFVVNGFDVTILIDICNAVIQAFDAGRLSDQHKIVLKNAHVILNASAKLGIKNLVYALAGYDIKRDETIRAFKIFVREEAREYEREFPSELYEQWYRLYELPRPDRNKPWKFKHLTVEHVYKPLARSNGKILRMLRTARMSSEERHTKLNQFLSEIGVKALRTHLGQLLGIAQISESDSEYERHVQKVFGSQLTLDLKD